MNKVLRKKLNKKGFTLIELIVVIAILGILAVIIVPRISGFSDSAKTSANASSAKALYNSVVIAIADDEISPGAGSYTGIGTESGELNIGAFLDEWPKDAFEENPLEVRIGSDGEVGVYQNATATDPLAGAVIAP